MQGDSQGYLVKCLIYNTSLSASTKKLNHGVDSDLPRKHYNVDSTDKKKQEKRWIVINKQLSIKQHIWTMAMALVNLSARFDN